MIDIKRLHKLEKEIDTIKDKIIKQSWLVHHIIGRRSSGAFVLMDIDNNSIDFRDRGGKQNPSYKFIKRLNTRRSILCTKERIERED